MAIVNSTDDSFYSASRCLNETEVLQRIEKAIAEGADILDIGGCSTRPDSIPVSTEQEWQRVKLALNIIKKKFPNTTISLDTFRSKVAELALQQFGQLIINDISGLTDARMIDVVAQAGVPYILTHSQPLLSHIDITTQVIDFFVHKIDILQRAGVKDIIIDPGFGFNKTTEQNWQLLSSLDHLNILDKNILIGISRKSMIQNLLCCDVHDTLNGTTAAHMLSLSKGADILRVHDVKEAKQAITIYSKSKI